MSFPVTISQHPWPRRLAVAAGSMGCAVALTHVFWRYLHHTPFLLGFCGVVLSSRAGGRGAGFLAVVLGVIGYSSFPPPLPDAGSGRFLLGFVVISAAFSWLVARRYEVEAALRSSEARLTEAQEVARLGTWQWDGANNELWWSDELYRIFGVDPASFQLSYPAFLQLVHPDDRSLIERVVHQGVQERTSYDVEHRIIRPDGAVRVINSHGRAVVGNDGQVIRIVGAAQDITERKASEEIVRRSERRLQTIFDAEPACVKLVSPDGILLDMNRAGLEIVGAQDKSQIVGKRVIDLVHPADRTTFLEMHQAASGGLPRRCEFRIVGLNDVEHWVDSHLVPFEMPTNQQETLRTVLSVTSDITERKHLEEQLRQAQKMEAIGRLAGGVAHDFNNLLMVIGGSAELAIETLPATHPIKDELRQICDAARRGASLTRQLLVFSRRQVIEPRLLDLNGALRDVNSMLKRLVGEDVQVITNLATRLTAVRADAGQLEQLVMNLAVNARDAMPRGGTLTIGTAHVQVSANDESVSQDISPGEYVKLTVTDTGIGMDANVKSHLFEPFFSTKPKGEGTGLGLATVYGIVRQSGGHIAVSSEPGQGTTVTVLLPSAEQAPAVESEIAEYEPSRGGSETVLVVEDETAVRELVAKILERHGYAVVSASSPKEAVAQIRSQHAGIDLLLTDVVMPVDSGPILAERLRRTFPSIPVLYMSGYTETALGAYGVLEPEIALLHKPFSSNELLSKIREILDTRSSSQ